MGSIGPFESALNEVSPAWWKEAIIYQIYPQSFCDSNGDGVGDLPGIISKLDYLRSLGVDVLWLSPIYKSPQKDMGYDISDYWTIHEPYGTVEDVDELIKGLHARGMKLMMDLVVNHTSDQHEWFKESRCSKSNPKRDWYIWRPARYDSAGNRVPPNNWMAAFRGSAWTWDELTQEYYLRLFTPEQPDLNWENPDVRFAVYDMMKSWLDRGVDGFRMDVINMISKRPGLPDASEFVKGQFLQPVVEHAVNGPRVHEFLREMNREVLSHYDAITVGECPATHDIDALVEYVKPENKELQMIFTFELHDIDGTPISSYQPRSFHLTEFKAVIEKYQIGMLEAGGWNSLYLENHDQARSINRFGNASPAFRALSAKLLALFHLTLSGTAYIYQGQELAMGNVSSSWTIEDFPDVATINYWNEVLEARRKASGDANPDMSDVLAGMQQKARDNARTPMQWSNSKNAGFTTGKPWMRVNDDYVEWNAASQTRDPESVWVFWQRMVQFRKDNPACTYGHFRQLTPEHAQIFAFVKLHPSQRLLVVLNFSGSEVKYPLPVELRESVKPMKTLLSNYDGGVLLSADQLVLRPYQGVVYQLR